MLDLSGSAEALRIPSSKSFGLSRLDVDAGLHFVQARFLVS